MDPSGDATDTPTDETGRRALPTGLVDLAARRLGGLVVATNDEFFGATDHLLDPRPADFDPRAFTDRGKLMDGWETRRRRAPGHDWCVVRLGVAGMVDAVIVDTSHFRGNHPEAVEVHGTVSDASTPPADAVWFPLLGRTRVRGDASQQFHLAGDRRVTHVRLDIHPDGGVARFRVLGRPRPDLHEVADPSGRLDLAAIVNGGRAVACSDAFFASPSNLIMVGDARDMGDGWETRRRRDDGHDWVVIQLAAIGEVERVEIDTTHFKGNYPDRCVVAVTHAPGAADDDELPEEDWTTIVPATPMRPHARHVLDAAARVPATHLRLSVLPDGGVARLRAFGRVTEQGWRRAGVQLLDVMEREAAEQVLRACCGSSRWVEQLLERRPFHEPDALLDTADQVWSQLSSDDHLEAFAAHPRIGERSNSRWSQREQAGADDADDDVRRRLHEGNVAYEQRFGHVFLIRAAGWSATEMLAALEERLEHDAATELAIAAEQQRQITRLRLEAWLQEGRHG